MTSERTFLPAAGHDWFLPMYDPLTRVFGFDRARRQLLDRAELESHHRILDVGCGTGTLAVLIKRLYPSVEVVAVDPDPNALARARRKAQRAPVFVRFDRAFADALAYPDATFDRVFSSMMFHHLSSDDKLPALREMHRVLKPAGRLELLDFAAPAHRPGMLGRLIHSHQRLKDNSNERVVALLRGAGFVNARTVGKESTMFGDVEFYQASRAAAPPPTFDSAADGTRQ